MQEELRVKVIEPLPHIRRRKQPNRPEYHGALVKLGNAYLVTDREPPASCLTIVIDNMPGVFIHIEPTILGELLEALQQGDTIHRTVHIVTEGTRL